MDEFVKERSSNINFCFWWHYLEMVSILLMFTRAQRDGIWDLHLFSFRCMLPYFMRYDHTNYARWGPIYLAEMHQLPEKVLEEFKKGNFVVKRSSANFNQVSPDQAQEWLNATGKKGGCVVGITKTASALSRWALSYNLRSHIAAETAMMLHCNMDDSLVHKEGGKSREKHDNDAENALYSTLQRFHVFSSCLSNEELQNITTKYLATSDVEQALINARSLGQSQLEDFVKDRLLLQNPAKKPKIMFRDSIPKNNPPTFASLYEVKKGEASTDKSKILTADRNILHRLITAYEAGREVNMQDVLKHELMPVPVSIAETNHKLRSGNKSVLVEVLTKDVDCPVAVSLIGDSALVIDGFALVAAVGKPEKAKTFGDLSDVFVGTVLSKGTAYRRVDIVFDRYREKSIKASTRTRRTRNVRAIRRVIEGRAVPLPSNWQAFLALGDNKADLARFLSEELIAKAPQHKIVVVSGGFKDEEEVQCSDSTVDIHELRCNHEEADTRIVLHVMHNNGYAENVVVSARDTDVLLLLLAHRHRISSKVWFAAGTAKKPKFIPLDDVYRKLPAETDKALLQFHAITGCDTTSYLFGHSKKTAWTVFKEHFYLLLSLGEGTLTTDTLKRAEAFVCRIYNTNVPSVDMARFMLFPKAGTPDKLPPTSDALKFHVMRAHYQAMVWRQAHCPRQILPKPEESGWELMNDKLVPVLMTLDPIPKACVEMITCNCTTGCATLR